MTGATHARELISTSLTLYQMLKLLQLGVVKEHAKYKDFLTKNTYYYMPVFNVDGLAYIEQIWLANH